MVSHDLQSPLSTVNINLALLRRQAESRGDATGIAQIQRMERTSNTMAERIKAILGYSRAGKGESPRDSVALGEALRDVLADMAADLERSGAQLSVGTLPIVRGDREQMKQVLQNLLSNAIKYAKPGTPPVIRVSSEERDAAWHVHIEDEGLGFDAGEVQQMLTPFRRLDRTRNIPGHGVGLATCVRILERHGGRLEATGTVEQGGRFTLVLPRPPPPGPTPAAEGPPEGTGLPQPQS